LKHIEITSDMTAQERLQILRTHYPEFEFLADEFVKLQDVFEDLQQQLAAETQLTNGTTGTISTTSVKSRALAAYIASLAMYFATFSSPARHSSLAKPMDPTELHDHPVCIKIQIMEQMLTS
jgi:U3 small nucleolar RNA-associated protein 3